MRTATTQEIRQKAKAEINKARQSLGLNALSFPEWLPTVTPQWTWDWKHQIYLYGKLQAVTDGTCKRLMIFLPPRHGKTECVTVRYPAYRLEANPKLAVILGSYNQNLANRFSRKVKRIAQSRIALAADRKAVAEWETPLGGGLRAVGVGAGVTGYGADLIMLDDPVKSREEAESETYRNKVWEWFNDDLYTRLHPNAAIILTMTRWHADDLAGRLLKEMADGGEQWEVVNLPALAEETGDPLGRNIGEALCPERYDLDALHRIQNKLGAYSFAALYQQRPVPIEGALFKRDSFQIINESSVPEKMRWVRYWDLAVKIKEHNDFSASVACALGKDGTLYLKDAIFGRWEYPDAKKIIIRTMKKEPKIRHGIEEALHGAAFVQELMRERGIVHVSIRGIRVDKDKKTRALAWADRAAEGKVAIVKGAWNEHFIEQCVLFPNGKHDDLVDSVSGGVSMISGTSRKLMFF